MLTTDEKKTLRERLIKYEKSIRHMYLDTKGNVTIGIGHMVPNLTAALKLNLVVAGGERSGAIATEAQITAEYQVVKRQQSGNMLAAYYKKYTKLMITEVEINRLTNQHIKSFAKELKRLFSDFDDYPTEVRLGLLDMVFNMGVTRLRNIFPTFCKAINAKKWAEAAAESNRPDVQPQRNQYVRELFEVAARDAEQVSTENQNTAL